MKLFFQFIFSISTHNSALPPTTAGRALNIPAPLFPRFSRSQTSPRCEPFNAPPSVDAPAVNWTRPEPGGIEHLVLLAALLLELALLLGRGVLVLLVLRDCLGRKQRVARSASECGGEWAVRLCEARVREGTHQGRSCSTRPR